MRIVFTLMLFLLGVLNNIDLSSQTSNHAPGSSQTNVTDSVDRDHASSSSNRHPPPSKSPILHRSRSPTAEPTLRERSRSPQARSMSRTASRSVPYILGYTLEEIKSIRLIPKSNPLRQFEIRRYSFPNDKRIHLRQEQVKLIPMPTEEQTVLSTSNGDVFAIVQSDKKLRGIYTFRRFTPKRAKMNIDTGVVEEMTPEEVRDSPLGFRLPGSTFFEMVKINVSLPRLIRFPILNKSP